MAESFTNALRGDEYQASSAGVAPGRVDPRAVAVMAEAGVDIAGQKSKAVDPFIGQDWDWVVTLCDNANESCPFFPGPGKRVHRGFDDPPLLVLGAADEEEALASYRGCVTRSRPWCWVCPATCKTDPKPGDAEDAALRR